MADLSLHSSILDVLQRLKVQELERLTDAELVSQYVTSHDAAAFTALVSRHGTTVLGVCRRVLRGDGVDDAFQATFLALAKQAGSIRRREAVGAWLYEVAYHTCLKARARAARSRVVEQAAAPGESIEYEDEVTYRDLQQVLDEELHRLPERLRRPLVLIDLLGRGQLEAARELGITDRALRKRLTIGRERLRLSLSRRGVTLTSVTIAAALGRQALASSLAAQLIRPTVDSVLAYAAGNTRAISPSTASLALGGSRWGLPRPILLSALVILPLLAAGLLTAFALLTTVESSPLAIAPPAPAPVEFVSRVTQTLRGQVLDADGKPVPHANVTALARRAWKSTERGLQDDVIGRGVADDAGRYHLTVPADFPSWSPDRKVTLLAHAPGHAPGLHAAPLRGPGKNDVRLPGQTTARGQLLTPTGEPAAGVRLTVARLAKSVREIIQGAPPSPPPPGWPADVLTDDTGHFQLIGLPAGEGLWLQVHDDRYALTTFPVRTGEKEENAPVTLSGPRVVAGLVRTADTGRPLADARIVVIVGPDQKTLDYYTALAADPDAATSLPTPELNGRTDAYGRFRLRLPPGTTYHVYAYPPEGKAYIGTHWMLTWAEGETIRQRVATLGPGRELHGQVVEEDGRPISGACVSWLSDITSATPQLSPSPRRTSDGNVLFSDSATLTGADGRFRIVVPMGPSYLRVIGPTVDYQLYKFDYEVCPHCGKKHHRPTEHARVLVSGAILNGTEPLRVPLKRGTTITGKVIGPDGEPIRQGVLMCRTVTQGLRKPAPKLVPIRDGVFELPGCVPNRSYPVLLLDAEGGLAAIAEVRVPRRGESPPTICLERCGTAKVRVLDAAGAPIVGERPGVWFWLPDDQPIIPGKPRPEIWSTPIDASWVDLRNYLSGPFTDADGVLTMPVLIPGVQYQASFSNYRPRAFFTDPFRVEPGQTLILPGLVAPSEDTPGGHGEPHHDKLPGSHPAPAKK